MQELQPKQLEIQNKYKGKNSAEDKQKMQQELMKVYQDAGTNPAMGCLPLVIQFPILIALYRVLQYVNDPKGKTNVTAIKNFSQVIRDKVMYLAHQNHNFLFIDLSKPGSKFIILPILAGLSTIIIFKFFQQPQPQQQPGQPDMKMMMNFMVVFSSVMTFFMAYKFPAGMSIYWITLNIFQLGQQYVLYHKIHKPRIEKQKEAEKKKVKTSK
jgi:YidC/Oxa1 family membrane protein insertase